MSITFKEGETPCKQWFYNYFIGMAIIYAVAGFISMLNAIMRYVIREMSQFEAHHTITARLSSAVTKMWVVQFVNSALVLLIINARYD